jgi:hypothetical protein
VERLVDWSLGVGSPRKSLITEVLTASANVGVVRMRSDGEIWVSRV